MVPEEQKVESKQFSLKRNETELLIFTKQHSDAIFSGLLSNLAADRLAYQVTERTQFSLEDNMTKLVITELPTPPTAEATPEGSGSVTAE